jgi:polyhydroxyalkanoate synthesis regulator phasin
MSTPLWRLAFDLVERPLAAASETWVQSDTFMDTTALGFKLQRRLTRQTEQALGAWLGLWGLASKRDVTALVNQVAALERQLRELRAEDRRP